MTDLQIYLTIAIFVGVIAVIAFDLIDMALATLIGACLMIAAGILNQDDFLISAQSAGGPLSLLFGGMVVAHVLESTGLFDYLGAPMLRATCGSGKRFLLLLVVLVAVVCSVLPNATTVILLAPIIIATAKALDVPF